MHPKLQGSFFHHYHFLPALLNGEGKPPHKNGCLLKKKPFLPKCWRSGSYSQDVSQGVKYPKTSLVRISIYSFSMNWKLQQNQPQNVLNKEGNLVWDIPNYATFSYLFEAILRVTSLPKTLSTSSLDLLFCWFGGRTKKNKTSPNGGLMVNYGDLLWQKVNNHLK